MERLYRRELLFLLFYSYNWIVHGLSSRISASDGVFRLRQTSQVDVSHNSSAVLFYLGSQNVSKHVDLFATYGPFHVSTAVEFHQCTNQIQGIKSQTASFAYDVSGHIVSEHILESYPVVKVLYLRQVRERSTISAAENSESVQNLSTCIVTALQWGSQYLTSFCVIDTDAEYCLTETILPLDLWRHQRSLSLFYHVRHQDVIRPGDVICSDIAASVQKSLSPLSEDSNSASHCLGDVGLESEKTTVRTHTTGDELLLLVPDKTVTAGTKFSLPVKLQAGSSLRAFSMRLRVRSGVRIYDVISKSPVWQVTSEISQRGDVASCVARLGDRVEHSTSGRVEDIFEWVMQSDRRPEADVARVAVTVDLSPATSSGSSSSSSSSGNRPGNNTVAARRKATPSSSPPVSSSSSEHKFTISISVRDAAVDSIIPVIQVREILNMAPLTGNAQSHALTIYTLSAYGHIDDVTKQCSCVTSNPDVLKVAPQCDTVHVDGSETGGGAVVVSMTCGGVVRRLPITVWYPDLPLTVDVTDDELNVVKGWRVPAAGSPSDCTAAHQRASVTVSGRFWSANSSGGGRVYFGGSDVRVDLTDHVIGRLAVRDVTVASIHGNVLAAVGAGLTQVEVTSAKLGVVGVTEVRVSYGRVTVDRLDVSVVTGLSMHVTGVADNLLTVNLTHFSDFGPHVKEAVLDVRVYFSDGHSMSISHLPADHYELNADSAKKSLLSLSSSPSSDLHLMSRPLEGHINVSFDMNKVCRRPGSRPLATGATVVLVSPLPTAAAGDERDVTEENIDLDSDGEEMYSGADDVSEQLVTKTETGLQQSAVGHSDNVGDSDDGFTFDDNSNSRHNARGKDRGVLGSKPALVSDDYTAPIDPHLTDNGDEQTAAAAAGAAPASGRISLQTALYILVIVLGVASLLFIGNCILFVLRCRPRRGSHAPLQRDGSSKRPIVASADEWVWLSPETLEKNSVHVSCQRKLMGDAEFHGRTSSHSSLRVTRASSTTPAPAPLDQTSHSSSGVSTYRGSECSVRITAASAADDDASGEEGEVEVEERRQGQGQGLHMDVDVGEGGLSAADDGDEDEEADESGVPHDRHLAAYFDNLKESVA